MRSAQLISNARVGCLDDAVLAEFVDGVLGVEARASVSEHISRCDECRRLVSELARGAIPRHEGASVAEDDVSTLDPLPELADSLVVSPGSTIGRYVVLARIGVGGLGIVYSAYDPELDRRVAVKLLRRTELAEDAASRGQERLMREAKALARLSHANVVAVHDAGVHQGHVYLAMDYVEGTTLREWMSGRRRPWREVVALFLEAGKGLLAAHEAGLVHRDFKPENVLVRRDAHVFVADFGVARAEFAPEANGAPGAGPAAARLTTLTRTGAFIGTPAYMAPEQFASGHVDARTDQFAFCVSLFEALHGQRPFSGATVRELAEAVRAGMAPDDKAGAGDVPPWLDRAVHRGLSVAQGDRFSSMRELLEALAPPSAARGSRWWVAAVVAASALTVAAAVVATRRKPPAAAPLCSGGPGEMGAVWGEPQRRAVHIGFDGTGAPFAADAFRSVERGLDAYSQAWVADYTQACEATRVRGEQSEKLLDQRMLCLDQRKKEVAALVALFSRADESTIEKSAEAVSTLPLSLSLCSASALIGAPVVPADPAQRANLDAVHEGLATATALSEAGRYKEALAIAKPAVLQAQALAYEPAVAEARYSLADIELALGDLDTGVKDGLDAAFDAESMRMDALAARAWGNLMFRAAGHPNYGDPHLYGRLAMGAADRVGGDGLLQGTLLGFSSWVYFQEQKFPESLDASERAASLVGQTLGTDSVAYAKQLNHVATALSGVGRLSDASADLERVMKIYTDVMGPDHPNAGLALANLGYMRYLLGDYEGAVDMNRRALVTVERAFGPDHPHVGLTLLRIGTALTDAGRPAEARPYEERALRIFEARFAPTDLQLAMTHYMMGEMELKAGNLRAAEKESQRAVALYRSETGEPLPFASGALDTLAREHRARHQLARASRDADEAVAILEKAHGDAQSLAECLTTQGELLEEQGAPEKARGPAERAVQLFETHPGDPHKLARARALVARLDAERG